MVAQARQARAKVDVEERDNLRMALAYRVWSAEGRGAKGAVADTVTIRGRAPGEADFFYTLDRVLGGLLAALKAGRVDEAVDVYTRCREDIGYQIISRAQGDAELFKQVANLFFRARDYARAAYCCEHLEEHAKAAQLYERCDDFAQAAQMYAAVGERQKSAEMFEKDGAHVEAGKLFRDLGDPLRAAACFERARKHFDAATCYQQAGKLEKAIEVLNLIDEDNPDRKVANKVIKELMAQAKLQRAPTQQIPVQSVEPVKSSGPTTPEPILLGGGQLPESGKGLVTVMEGFELLHSLPLFAEVSLPELKSLYHLCEVKNVAAGEAVIRAGAPADALSIVIAGQLQVRAPGATVPISVVGPGQHVGDMSFVDDGAAAVDVVAVAPSRLLRLEKDGFRQVLHTQDGLALRIYRAINQVLTARLRETTARLAQGAS